MIKSWVEMLKLYIWFLYCVEMSCYVEYNYLMLDSNNFLVYKFYFKWCSFGVSYD